jgi:hypothetical protein
MHGLYSQTKISLGDTIKLSGIVIRDMKKDKFYFRTGSFVDKEWRESELKYLIKNSDYRYLMHTDVLGLYLRTYKKRLNFCTNGRKSEYSKNYKIIADRYLISIITDEYFIELYLDGKKRGITLKCW